MIHKLGQKTPVIDKDAFIEESAHVIGDTVIEKDCSVWFGAVIRADFDKITIGKNSNVQDNCTLHSDEGFPIHIGENVTIGHNAVIHGCKINDNTIIGMNATVLNGAVIGKNCIIGAGAVVKEKAEIPDNSLVVGIPAKVIKELDEEAIKHLKNNADEYRELAKIYQA